jgi:hypothetical protein
VPYLVKSLNDLGGAGVMHSYKKTLGLPERARHFRCHKLLAASFHNGIPEPSEVDNFIAEDLPNGVFIAELRAAQSVQAHQTFPSIPITTLESEESVLTWVPTSPLDSSSIESVFALLEGPDLVGMQDSNGTTLNRAMGALLAQAGKEGPKGVPLKGLKGGAPNARLIKGASTTAPPGLLLPEMYALWIKWPGGKDTDPEAAFLGMLHDDKLAGLPEAIAVAHTKPEEIEWRLTTVRYPTVESVERACRMIVAAGYNCVLCQSRGLGGSNPFTRTVSVPQRAVDAAGGLDSICTLLKEQLDEYDPSIVITPRPATTAGPPKLVLKFSTLGGVDRARGKIEVFQDEERLCDLHISAQPLITHVGQIVIEADGPAGSGSVDLDLEAIRAAVQAFAPPRKGRAEVWQLRDDSFCFRVLPCSVGIELARIGSLMVNGQRLRLSLSYVANSTVSMGPLESRPSATSLLEVWVVSMPASIFFYATGLQISLCFPSNLIANHTPLPQSLVLAPTLNVSEMCPQDLFMLHKQLAFAKGTSPAAHRSLHSLTLVATTSTTKLSVKKVAAFLSPLSSHRFAHSRMFILDFSVRQMWRASTLGMLQILSHSLCSLTLRRFTYEKAALLEVVDTFLVPRQHQPNQWPARPFRELTSIIMPVSALNSNVSFHVLTGVGFSQQSTSRRARKGHLTGTARLKAVSQGTLELEGRPPLYVLCGKTHSSHGDPMIFALHYRGDNQVDASVIPNWNVWTPLTCSSMRRAKNGTMVFGKYTPMDAIHRSSYHSSNVISDFNRASKMHVMMPVRIALLLALTVSIIAILRCRQLALYFIMLFYQIPKLPRLCRLRRNRCLRHRASHELRNSRNVVHRVPFIIYLTIYYIMLEHSLGQSTLQPCSWVANNVRGRRSRKSFPPTIRRLGRNIETGIASLKNSITI